MHQENISDAITGEDLSVRPKRSIDAKLTVMVREAQKGRLHISALEPVTNHVLTDAGVCARPHSSSVRNNAGNEVAIYGQAQGFDH